MEKDITVAHQFLGGLSQPGLLLHRLAHFLEDGGGQLHVQTFRVGRHLAEQLLVGEDAVAVEAPVVGHALAAHGQPVGRAEVHRLGEVVALVEAAVVGPREGHHELPRALVGSVHLCGGTQRARQVTNRPSAAVLFSSKKKCGHDSGDVRGLRAPSGRWGS